MAVSELRFSVGVSVLHSTIVGRRQYWRWQKQIKRKEHCGDWWECVRVRLKRHLTNDLCFRNFQ